MASLPFSCSSVPGLKIHPNRTTMASFVTSIKSSLGPSKSAFLQRGFSLQSPNLPGFASKARSFGVFARAATEKSVHDFTVKVLALLIKLFVFLQYWFNCSVYHLFESWKLGFVLISLAWFRSLELIVHEVVRFQLSRCKDKSLLFELVKVLNLKCFCTSWTGRVHKNQEQCTLEYSFCGCKIWRS